MATKGDKPAVKPEKPQTKPKPSKKTPAKSQSSSKKKPNIKIKVPKVNPPRPGWTVHAHPVETGKGQRLKQGLYWHGVRDDNEIDTFICSPLEVIAITSDERGENYGRLLQVLTPKGVWRQWAAPMEMLAGDGSELRGVLLNMGAIIPHKQRQALTDYLMQSTPRKEVMAATRTGWHGDSLFVMPHKVIGVGDVVFQSTEASGHEYASAGDFSIWQREIGTRCVGNPVLILAVCSSLAGVLLNPLGIDGGGFHLLGDSSSGKSIALQIAASVWGNPSDFLRTWNATITGLEGVATLRNDTLLVLDEIGEAKPQDIGGIIYALGNGVGRQRGKVSGLPRAVQKWRVMVLSSGELTMSKHMESSGLKSKTGQELRLLDIPTYREFGVFDNLHGLTSPQSDGDKKGAGRVFADTLKRLASQHYGHLGAAFVQALIETNKQPEAAKQLEESYATIRKQFPAYTGQEARAAARFAIIALAGEIAIQAKLLPWAQGTALNAALTMFESWVNFRGRGQSEDAKILRAVSDFINRYGSRFESYDGLEARVVNDRAGWFRASSDGGQYLFTPQALTEAAAGFDLKRVLSCLHYAGAIVERDGDREGRYSKKVRIKKENLTVRVYVVNSAALLSSLEE